MRCTVHLVTAPVRWQWCGGAARMAYLGSQKNSVKKEKQAMSQMMN